MVAILRNSDFVWRGLSLHFGRRRKPVLTLVQDLNFPHLYRILYPDGWTSRPANITWAKDAAFGHARYLLAQETPAEGTYNPEMGRAAQ